MSNLKNREMSFEGRVFPSRSECIRTLIREGRDRSTVSKQMGIAYAYVNSVCMSMTDIPPIPNRKDFEKDGKTYPTKAHYIRARFAIGDITKYALAKEMGTPYSYVHACLKVKQLKEVPVEV